eukprot:Rmarinus@m.23066
MKFLNVATALVMAQAAAAVPGLRDVSTQHKLHPELESELMNTDSADVFVKMSTSVDFGGIQALDFESRGAKIAHIHKTLRAHAEESQSDLHAHLEKRGGHSARKSSWIANGVFIDAAEEELIRELAQRPDVATIEHVGAIELIEPLGEAKMTSRDPVTEWSVEYVQAPSVWESGNTGEGIVVGVLDTGARYTHEALRDSYRGYDSASGSYDHDYNFFITSYNEPGDQNGHGTHCAGTVAGTKGIGVAPGAKWIAAQALNARGSGTTKGLLDAAEFLLCPTRLDGSDADCSKAPHIVSNSWGGSSGDSWFYDMVEAWKAADIIPVFANGNSGPSCNTVNSPGDYDNVIGVGATDSSNALSSFSSRGPSNNVHFTGAVKPDISAPGEAITSAWFEDDAQYNTISGTSMATPAVSGVIALLMNERGENLSYDEVYSYITESTAAMHGHGLPDPHGWQATCGDTHYTQFPNNFYGHGIVNAYAACKGEPVDNPSVGCETKSWSDCSGMSDCGPCQWAWFELSCVCADAE